MSGLALQISYETVVEHGAAVQALSLVGLTALLYDHVLTLGQEVTLIWRAPAGFVSVVFVLNRYVVPLVLAVDMYELSGLAPNSAMFCKIWTAVQSYITIASFMSIHAVMAIRVYALHNGSRFMKRLLWTTSILYLLSSTVIVTVLQIPVIDDLHPVHHQCVSTIPPELWLSWLPTVIFESLLFMLTLSALLRETDSHSLSTLILILYRDGMLHFVAVTSCSIFSLLVWAMAPPTLSGLARYFALAVVNVVASRMVLNLKSYAASRRQPIINNDPLTDPFASFAFIPYMPPSPPDRFRQPVRSSDPPSSLDLEMYAIEREFQQLGTKLQ